MDNYDYYSKTIKKFTQRLEKDPNNLGCFVLGSYARKQLGRFSDVDLYVICRQIQNSQTDWLLFDDIYFSVNYYTEEKLRKFIDFNPKTFVEYGDTFEHVVIFFDHERTIINAVKKAKDNALKVSTDEGLFKNTISSEFSALSEEICKVANAVEREDEIDFNMVSFFSVMLILKCLQMANKLKIKTENNFVSQSFEMEHKPAHFEQDIKVLLRFESTTFFGKIKSIIRFYNESFSLLKKLHYLTDKAIIECTFLQENVLSYLETFLES